MTKLVLPALINPPTIRKDGSIKISFDSRELSAEEYLTVMGFRNCEGWLAFQPTEAGIPELPTEKAEIDVKTPSERLKNVLYVWFRQEVDKGSYVGLFEAFRAEKMEKIIETIKGKLN